MPLLQFIAGGALQGLGQGLTRQAEHRKELNGLALRDKYISAREDKDRKFRMEENREDRLHSTEESRLDRVHSTEQSRLSRDQVKAEAGADREQSKTQFAARLKQTKDEFKARIARWKVDDKRYADNLADTLAASVMKSEDEVEKARLKTLPKPRTEAEIVEAAEKFNTTYDTDEDGNQILDAEPIIDHLQAESDARFYRERGEWPQLYATGLKEVKALMKKHKQTIQQVIDGLAARDISVSREVALALLEDETISRWRARPSGSPNPIAVHQKKYAR